MSANSRFGGHFVQGHVDATAVITGRIPDGNSLRLSFHLPSPSSPNTEDLIPFLIAKGYITIDGASLTITSVNDNERSFSVMLIAHTQNKITLSKRVIGDKVNIEVDMIGKYVQRSVQGYQPPTN
jgi:riboflavin synthase